MTLLTVMEYMYHKWPHVPLVIHTSQYFPHSWLITGFLARLTWRVQLVEQELITLPEHLSSPPDFSGARVTRSFALCVCFVGRFLFFILLVIMLSVLQFTTSGYPFGIFKLFLCKIYVLLWVCISIMTLSSLLCFILFINLASTTVMIIMKLIVSVVIFCLQRYIF
jgi:hypothetical protein